MPSVWTIQSGDRIGFTSILAGSIGCAPSSSYEADDLETLTTFSGTNGSSVLGSSLKRLTSIRHQVSLTTDATFPEERKVIYISVINFNPALLSLV